MSDDDRHVLVVPRLRPEMTPVQVHELAELRAGIMEQERRKSEAAAIRLDEMGRMAGPKLRAVDVGSIDAASLAHADRPSASEAHAADLSELLERARADLSAQHETSKLLEQRLEAERKAHAATRECMRQPRQHGRLVSLVLFLAGER